MWKGEGWTKLSLWYSKPLGGVKGSMQTQPRGVEYLFSTYLNCEQSSEGPDTCQLVTGVGTEGHSWVSSFSKHTALKSLLLGMVICE